MLRRRSISPPKYRKHRQSGQAIVTLSDAIGRRKDYLLGRYGSAESRREYGRLINEWEAAGQSIPHTGPAPADLTVNEFLVRFRTHAEAYYRDPDGAPSGELDGYRLSLRPLRQLYGHTQAREFGPLSLKTVRQAMIDAKLSRKVINQRIGRVKRLFKWGVAEQLIPADKLSALRAVVPRADTAREPSRCCEESEPGPRQVD